MFHVPGISDSEIGHVDGGDSYSDCVNLAKTNSTWAPLNTHSLQFFAAEVYANTVAAPGVGCLGTPSADSGHAAPAAPPSSSAAHDDHAHSDDDHDHASTSAGATPTAAAAGLAPSPTVRRICPTLADLPGVCGLPASRRPLAVRGRTTPNGTDLSSCEGPRPTA